MLACRSYKRPTAEEIRDVTYNWCFYGLQEIKDQINKGEEIRQRNIKTKKEKRQTQHPGAIYTSRLMPNLTKGKKNIYCCINLIILF